MTTTIAVVLNYLAVAATELAVRNTPEIFHEELSQEITEISEELADHLGFTVEELSKAALEWDKEILWVRISPDIEGKLKELAESLVPLLGDTFRWTPEKALPPLIPPKA